MATSLVPEAAEKLRRWVERTQFGALAPVAVSVTVDEDGSGQTAVFFDVTLPAPEAPNATWPIEQVLALHEQVDARAKELGLDLPWYVRLVPASSDEEDLVEAEEE